MKTAETDLARQICLCYRRERTRFDTLKNGGASPAKSTGSARFGPKPQDDVWVQLVRFCRSRRIDPLAYIEWHFDNALLGSLREPKRLMDRKLAADFLADEEQERPEIEIAFRVQQQTARVHILLAQQGGKRTAGDAWASVLLDETLSLSALYRYCLAHSIGGDRFDRIAGLYEDEAIRQYRRNRSDYDVTWGQWVPATIRKHS
jgi:hypothetical protein